MELYRITEDTVNNETELTLDAAGGPSWSRIVNTGVHHEYASALKELVDEYTEWARDL